MCCFFYGAEDFLMNWAVDSIVNDYVDEAPGTSI